MSDSDIVKATDLLENIRRQAATENIRITQHAQQEMTEEEIALDDILQAIATAQILEDYPEHKRGACCLLNGFTPRGRFIHVVCTTAHSVLIIITTYEPQPPKWVTPTQRGR
jgi:hypothetical protein